ncbi:MAG: hypothetical protein ACD_45C00112G0001, partial [uncultured bacterium]
QYQKKLDQETAPTEEKRTPPASTSGLFASSTTKDAADESVTPPSKGPSMGGSD